jgi:hypothetical protein
MQRQLDAIQTLLKRALQQKAAPNLTRYGEYVRMGRICSIPKGSRHAVAMFCVQHANPTA